MSKKKGGVVVCSVEDWHAEDGGFYGQVLDVDNPVSVDVTQTWTGGSEGAGNNDEV